MKNSGPTLTRQLDPAIAGDAAGGCSFNSAAGSTSQRLRYLLDYRDGRIVDAPLKRADIGTIYARLTGQLFLRHVLCFRRRRRFWAKTHGGKASALWGVSPRSMLLNRSLGAVFGFQFTTSRFRQVRIGRANGPPRSFHVAQGADRS